MVRDSLLRSAPFVASAVRLALFAPSVLRCRGAPRPVALGPTPLPKGKTSKGGGRCPGEPHARSHLGPMHIWEDVQEPTPLPTSHAHCPEQASALLHPHYCRHPRRCGLQQPGCDVQVLQQELLGNARGGGVIHHRTPEHEKNGKEGGCNQGRTSHHRFAHYVCCFILIHTPFCEERQYRGQE